MGFFAALLGESNRKRPNYVKNRKVALANADKDRWGNVKDIYTGKRHKPKNMDADHIWAYSRGGSNKSYNLGMTHKRINRSVKRAKVNGMIIKGYSAKVRTHAKRKPKTYAIGGSIIASGIAATFSDW
jgi:hypothetical protein